MAKRPSGAPAGWYPDPSRRSGERYWDGSGWGERRGNSLAATPSGGVVGTAKAKPVAGWYPDPRMAGTQRYWDGAKWTDHVAPASPVKKEADPRLLKKIAWAIAFAFLLPVLLITINEPSYGGHACGTWFNSNYSDLEVTTKQTDLILGNDTSYSSVLELDLIASKCNDKLASERTLVYILLGLGGGMRIAIPLIVRAIRE